MVKIGEKPSFAKGYGGQVRTFDRQLWRPADVFYSIRCYRRSSVEILQNILGDQMDNFDPRKVIDILRSHLAIHDTPLSFIFGAGTSCSVTVPEEKDPTKTRPLIPDVAGLTNECKKKVIAIGKKYPPAWEAIVRECTEAREVANIETILSRVRAKIDAMGSDDLSVGLNRNELKEFETMTRKTIAQIAAPDLDKIPLKTPHSDFALWIKQITRKRPVEIFTTNYDVLIERALERARIPVFDGFVGCHETFFCPEYLRKDCFPLGGEWVKLWKIHGSVNWQRIKRGRDSSITRGQVIKDGEMILPSLRKYDESRKLPYQAMLDRLGTVLSYDGSIMVTCGFSFGDQHINEVIFNALDNYPLSHVISLQYGDISPDSFLIKAAAERPNFMVLGRKSGIIRGKHVGWWLSEQVDKKTHSFMDILFDSDAEPDPNKKSHTGELLTGDFVRLCHALAEMGGEVTATDTTKVVTQDANTPIEKADADKNKEVTT